VDPAVSETDKSDSHGIQADGIDAKKRVYRLRSWEGITSPRDSLRRALLWAVELGADRVGVETDQGGMTWRSVYREAWQSLKEDGLVPKKAVARGSPRRRPAPGTVRRWSGRSGCWPTTSAAT
jgi:phage terminase large subunit-like protein